MGSPLTPAKRKDIALITPVLNGMPYVREFVDSVLGQEGVSLDLYIFDGGSTDGTAQFLENASRLDSRVRLAAKPGKGGISFARNAAIDEMLRSGTAYDFIYYCDADDLVKDPSLLARVLQNLRKYSADYAVFSVMDFTKSRSFSAPVKIKNVTALDHDEVVRQYFRSGLKWRHEASSKAFLGNKIFKTDIALKARFDPRLKVDEDFAYMLEILPYIQKGVLVPDAWFWYRLRKSSACHSTSRRYELEVCTKAYGEERRRSLTEMKEIQHRLLRSIYSAMRERLLAGDEDALKAIEGQYDKLRLRYPLGAKDFKIAAVLSLPKSLRRRFFRTAPRTAPDTRDWFD